jgi:hypothetical protein
LACVGISLLEHDLIKSAQRCASVIVALVIKVAAQHPRASIIADLHVRLEILARAADALGQAPAAVAIRAMIQRPATITDADWPHYMDAQQDRIRHLDGSLHERRDRYAAIHDDPISELQRILNRGTA